MISKCGTLIFMILTVFGCSTSSQVHSEFDRPANQQEVVSSLVEEFLAERYAGIEPADVNANQCFADYQKQQAIITTKYNQDYNLCIKTASDAREQLSEESAKERLQMIGRGESICSDLSDCNVHSDGLDFFQCYTKASKKNHPRLYDISVDSEAQELSLNVKYSEINNNEKSCTSFALVEYIADLTEASTELNNCLNGSINTTTPEVPNTPTKESPADYKDAEKLIENQYFELWNTLNRMRGV